jgi:bacterioferritin
LASKTLLNMLNRAIAAELQVSIQYMWQHVLWRGISGLSVRDELKSIAITEMKHAEKIAERLAYLGGTPTTKPDPAFVGFDLGEMLRLDEKAEEEAILLYQRIIETASGENDFTTKRIFEQILEEEEAHLDTFSTHLVGLVELSPPP